MTNDHTTLTPVCRALLKFLSNFPVGLAYCVARASFRYIYEVNFDMDGMNTANNVYGKQSKFNSCGFGTQLSLVLPASFCTGLCCVEQFILPFNLKVFFIICHQHSFHPSLFNLMINIKLYFQSS